MEIKTQNLLIELKEVIILDDFDRGVRLWNELKQQRFLKNADLSNEERNLFSNMVVKLKWIILPCLQWEQAADLFQDSINVIFEIDDFDLAAKVRGFLLGIDDYQERDVIKSKIKDILSRNQSLVSNKKINNQQDQPTLANWLRIYNSNLGLGPVDSIKLNQFYIQNRDFNNLDANLKIRMRKLFDFYEKMKYSSTSVAGIEDTVPVNTPNFVGEIKNGKLIKYDKEMDRDLKTIYDIASRVLGEKSQVVETSSRSEKSLQNTSVGMDRVSRPQTPSRIPNVGVVKTERQTRINELRRVAGMYPDGSLERKAVIEEIRKLDH